MVVAGRGLSPAGGIPPRRHEEHPLSPACTTIATLIIDPIMYRLISQAVFGSGFFMPAHLLRDENNARGLEGRADLMLATPPSGLPPIPAGGVRLVTIPTKERFGAAHVAWRLDRWRQGCDRAGTAAERKR